MESQTQQAEHLCNNPSTITRWGVETFQNHRPAIPAQMTEKILFQRWKVRTKTSGGLEFPQAMPHVITHKAAHTHRTRTKSTGVKNILGLSAGIPVGICGLSTWPCGSIIPQLSEKNTGQTNAGRDKLHNPQHHTLPRIHTSTPAYMLTNIHAYI